MTLAANAEDGKHTSMSIATLTSGIITRLFNPMWLRLQRAINRLMYGERNDPVAVLTQELEAKVKELQESRSRIVAVQEGVRREIASHLHGRAQGRLLLTSIKLQKALTDAGESSEIAGPIRDAIRDIDQVINDDLRVLSRRLYPSILDLGLIPALESLGDQFAEAFHVQFSVDEPLQDEELDNPEMMTQQVRLAGYRIAEEALTNAVKHAEASRIRIRVDRPINRPGHGVLTLQIADDGKGFDASAVTTGLGTATIYDQIGAGGGEVTIRSVPGEGTTVTATLPLAGDREAPAN